MLAVANAGSSVGPQNKIGHSARYHKRLMQLPVLSAHDMEIDSKTCSTVHHKSQSEIYLWFIGCSGFSRGVKHVKSFNRVAVKRNFIVMMTFEKWPGDRGSFVALSTNRRMSATGTNFRLWKWRNSDN